MPRLLRQFPRCVFASLREALPFSIFSRQDAKGAKVFGPGVMGARDLPDARRLWKNRVYPVILSRRNSSFHDTTVFANSCTKNVPAKSHPAHQHGGRYRGQDHLFSRREKVAITIAITLLIRFPSP